MRFVRACSPQPKRSATQGLTLRPAAYAPAGQERSASSSASGFVTSSRIRPRLRFSAVSRKGWGTPIWGCS